MTALRPTPSVPADATGSYDGATAGPPRRHRVRPVVVVSLPTPAGEFEAHAFEVSSGTVYLALVKGEVAGVGSVLTRVHSECLTGDVLGSLRCDCGLQLRIAMREIAAEGRGVLLYATGHEGRGIGLINKLRAYTHQDRGLDTIDANLHLGLPVDARSFGDAADVLMGIRSLLVEGGSRIITSMLAERLADRLIVAIAPTIVGSGTEAVGDLSIHRIAHGVRLANRSVHVLDDDVLLAWDVAEARNGVLCDTTRAPSS